MVDVGPTKEGTIPVIMQERLLQMGKFLKVNGEAVRSKKSSVELVVNINFYIF